MIAELLARELSPDRWGAKAARLSAAARHGIPVPLGLCLDLSQADAPAAQQRTVLAEWLAACRPPVLVVRSSATAEDGGAHSAAGRFLTLRDVSADPDSVLAAVHLVQASLTAASSGGSVIVQQQLPADLMGVAFTRPGDSFIAEGSPTAAAVTDGATPDFRLSCQGQSYTLHGSLNALPPVLLARHLRRLTTELRQVFDGELDIEWATVAGQPFLLQARPITTPVEDL